jgi:GT2 family glycosyltransferase
VFNGGDLAVGAVGSLLAQDHPLAVLVVVDGSTTDDAERLRDEFGERIRLVEHANLGLSRTLNHAIEELVDTPLVARLDHDDRALPGRIAAQVDLIERTGADAVLSAYWRVGANGRRLARHPDLGRSTDPVAYSPRSMGQIVHSTLLARTEVLRRLGGYRQELWPADDFDLSIRLWQQGTVLVDPTPLVEYRVSDDSWTRLARERMADTTRYLEAALAADEPLPPFEDWAAANPAGRFDQIGLRGRWFYRSAGAAFGDGRPLTGSARLAAAMACNPRHTLRRLVPALRAQVSNRSTSPT